MLGVVLCGGISSRMGSDKGLLPSAKGNWAGMMLDKMKELNIPTALSVNKTQVAYYENHFPETELIVDNESITLKGPLAALLSVHVKYATKDLFIVACDMPLLETVVLRELYNYHQKDSENEGFVYTNNGEPEPLCAIYNANGLAIIKSMYDHGQLTRHSMKFMLDHISVLRIPIPEKWKMYFRNMNTHADLNGL